MKLSSFVVFALTTVSVQAKGKPAKDDSDLLDDSQSSSGNGAKDTCIPNGTCMGDDSCGLVQGLSEPTGLLCTAKDVAITKVSLVQGPASCTPGSLVSASFSADLQSTSNARRSDIGIWIASDFNSNAKTSGTCSHFWFQATSDLENPNLALGQLPDFDSSDEGSNGQPDGCGDIANKALYEGVAMVHPQNTITIPCVDTDGDGYVDIDYCVAWKVPGQDTAGNGCSADGDQSVARANTVPGTRAKCRCEVIATVSFVYKNANSSMSSISQ